MRNVEAALEACFLVLSKEYDIEEVDSIPQLEHLPRMRIWKVQIPALVLGKAEDIETYILFPKTFSYSMPCVIIPDDRFRHLPHISVKMRKLCLYEDDEVYDVENIEGLIRDNIDRTRRWIENYYGQDNSDEYTKEIRSYWNEQYDGENNVDDHWILLGDIPTETCEMTGVVYTNKYLNKNNTYVMNIIASDEDDKTLARIKLLHKTRDIHALYIASLKIPNVPPFSLTGQEVIDRINDDKDRDVFKKYLNHFKNVNVLFPIGLNYAAGGICIYGLKVNRNGYRKGALTSFKVLTSFENKNKKLDRLHLSVYSNQRITERTAGTMMEEKRFLVAGLGSVGSNLCYYLNGYNNAVFDLIDRDSLIIDNIGRHLLGFEYINQQKSYAVAHYLQQYRPDREVYALQKQLQQQKKDEINKASAIFVCTGDVMSEKWLLSQMFEESIRKPAFILWLEPYGISGIMIYVNPKDKESIKRLREKANDCFMDFCLIKREEYEDGEKLTKRDAGCNGSYSLYSANDVILFLSSMFPIIDKLLEEPSESRCYQWVGNINIATKKGISLMSSSGLSKNTLREQAV
mgnify:CR=1 FL=1